MSDEDVNIIVDLIKKVQPHQIYAAGDLSDPHGTHRVCLEAIFRALDKLKGEAWMKDCYVMVVIVVHGRSGTSTRSKWAVPLSPDELMRKRKAIFKHQSQKDSALFPGSDKREFWMRAEDRNHATAHLYNQLGLSEYEAIRSVCKTYILGMALLHLVNWNVNGIRAIIKKDFLKDVRQ